MDWIICVCWLVHWGGDSGGFYRGLDGRIRMTLCVLGLEIRFINMCYGFGANGLHVNQLIFLMLKYMQRACFCFFGCFLEVGALACRRSAHNVENGVPMM